MQRSVSISAGALFAAAFIIVAALSALSWWQLGSPLTGVDDANIFFVYARHLADGHGFVYNIGGERVEGFSSLLWVLICAVAMRVSPAPELMLTVTSVVLTSAALFFAMLWIARHLVTGALRPAAMLAVFLCLTLTPGFIAWSALTLMEVGLWSALVLLATFVVVTDTTKDARRRSRQISVVAALMLLTRPESFVFVPVLLFAMFLTRQSSVGAKAAAASLVLPCLTAAATFAAVTTFRLYYFGFPLPNTYYAKVSPSLLYNVTAGARYLRDFSLSGVIEALAVLAAVIGTLLSISDGLRQRGWGNAVSALPCLALAGLLLPVLAGGDHFRQFRVYQPIWPLLAMNLFFFTLVQFPQLSRGAPFVRDRRMAVAAIAVSGIALAGLQAARWNEGVSAIAGDFTDAVEGRKLGELLNEMFEASPLPSLGAGTAGGIKVTYRGTVIDMLGLNNTAIAHNRGDRVGMAGHAAFEKRTFFELKPDIFLPALADRRVPAEIGFALDDAYKQMGEDPAFRSAYVYGDLDSRGDEVVRGYFRRDFLRTAQDRGLLLSLVPARLE